MVLLRLACVLLLAFGLGGRALLAKRVVAVGDIHGDYDSLVSVLKAAGLLDQQLHWSGGDATFVQTGDFLDRGKQVRSVMDLLRSMQREAPLAGGRVLVLLGNHEAMNLLAFRNDVNPETYAEFVDEHSKERQDAAWKEYRRWAQSSRQRKRAQPEFEPMDERTWRREHPLGFAEYVEALGVGGEYGDWLRGLPMIARLGDVVFVHGGISASLSSQPLEGLNDRARDEVTRLDRCRDTLLEQNAIVHSSTANEMIAEGLALLSDLVARVPREPRAIGAQLERRVEILRDCLDYEHWFLVDTTSPIWYRGYARLDEEAGLPMMQQVLDAYDARHFVVGHTPQASGRIVPRFDARVLLIDTGMLQSVYHGTPSALEIEDGRYTAIYPDGRELLAVDELVSDLRGEGGEGEGSLSPSRASALPYHGPDGEPLPFADDDQVLDFLASASVVESKQLDSGTTHPYRMLLERDGIQTHAIFRDVDLSEFGRHEGARLIARFRDSYRYEPAAYQLSRLIHLDRVPPTVLRTLERRSGSLQLWIYGVFDDEKRIKEKLEPPVPRDWAEELAMRKLFDQLIDNLDRNTGNTLIDKKTWRMWLIDHTRSFTDSKELADHEAITRCAHRVYEALRALDLETLEQHLQPMLDQIELEALDARRKEIVELLEARIDKYGESAVLFDWPAR